LFSLDAIGRGKKTAVHVPYWSNVTMYPLMLLC
jgi:hypothetical protein